MSEVVSLFPHIHEEVTAISPKALFGEASDAAVDADKAIAITIDCHGFGKDLWNVTWTTANMSNADVLMALDIMRYKIVHTIMGA